jgi:ankyrin repeat protein
MNNKRLISLAICFILSVVSVLSISLFADNESEINTEAEQHYEKAYELRKVTDYDAAISEYEKVISLSPNSKIAQNAQYWIGQSYFESKRFDSALSAFQSLLDKYPASSIAPTTKTMIERVQLAKKNRALFEAVNKADVEQVKLLISQGADVDARLGDLYSKDEETLRPKDSDRTALRRAVKTGNMEVVKLLVEAGADVNAGDWPPLLQAVEENNTAIAEYLIDHGANVNPRGDKDPWDWGPIQYASGLKINNIEMIKLLIAKGADISVGGSITALQMALFTGRRDVFDLLIQHGADVNAKDYQGGYTPLYFAIHSDDSYYMNTLIAKGADVNSKYQEGETLLGSAAITGRTESVKVLLEAGADVNARDDNGQTALHLPLDIRNSNYKKYKLSKNTLILLLNKGADVNLKDDNGCSPLHLAAESADVDIVEILLDKGADINAKDDKSGSTALHHAARLGKIDIAELLISRGADINAKDNEGHTPLYIAVNNDYKAAEMLIEKGADSTIKTKSGQTLLQLAQERNKRESFVPDMIFDGDPNSGFGAKIACGDIDGDGYVDILIDARIYDNFRGRVCLYYGGPGMDNEPDLILEGQNQGDSFGDGIACGDIDNDGYEDIVIAAGGYNESRGRAYLYWGSDRKSMDTKPDKVFAEDVNIGAYFSLGYPAVYDIDNDGYRDIVLGACAYWRPGDGRGRAYLYYGNNKELMDTSYDLIFPAENLRDQFGHRIACGDVDNDGFGDIVIGTLDFPRGNQQDRTYLYYGNSKSNMDAKADVIFEARSESENYVSGIVCIDQNRDGYDDLVIGDLGYNNKQGRVYLFHGNSKRSIDTDPDMIFEGEVEQSDYGVQVVCGDVDGDNVSDIIIGARGSGQTVGRVCVYWGKELTAPDLKPGRIFTGENPNDWFGFGLACGDINNDGFDDLVVGALKAEANQGRAYLYYGGPK